MALAIQLRGRAFQSLKRTGNGFRRLLAGAALVAWFGTAASAGVDNVDLAGSGPVEPGWTPDDPREASQIMLDAGPGDANYGLSAARRRVEADPDNRAAWQALIAAYAQMDRYEDAFEASKLMYLNGLFEEERELIRLAQYYSFFEYPYRGALILEREMNAGRVQSSLENLEMLADIWRQASEFDRAVTVLRRLSDLDQSGEGAYRLAEAYYQEYRFAKAEEALETALRRGGLSDPGKVWELLGNVRYEQIGDLTVDREKAERALEAFRSAQDYSSSRRAATGWIRFIEARLGVRPHPPPGHHAIQLVIDSCRLTLEQTLNAEFEAEGGEWGDRIEIPAGHFPERCRVYFNAYGEQIREAHWSDEEFEAAQARRAANSHDG